MIEKLREYFIRKTGRLISFTKKIFLPGMKGESLYDILYFFRVGFKKNSIVDRAYAISYKFILASFPFTIFLLSIIPFIPILGLQEEILSHILNSFPEPVLPYIDSFFNDLLLKKKTSVVSIGFLLTIFFASNAMTAILNGFNKSYHLHRIKRKKSNLRLWSVGLLFILTLLLIATTVVYLLGGRLILYIENNYGYNHMFFHVVFVLFEWLILLALFMSAISILYNIGNSEKVKWQFFSPGLFISTTLIIIFSELFSLFVNYFAPYDRLYGSLGTIIILLLFIYYFFAILLIGFELNMSIQSAANKRQNQV